MATITGTILGVADTGSWVLTFVSQDTPHAIGSNVVVAQAFRKLVTDSAGGLPSGFELQEGAYTVKINNGEEFEIEVPSGDGSYDISSLIVSDGEFSRYTPAGHGSPEGVVPGSPGWKYLDLDTGDEWTKYTGTGKTGWVKVID